MAEASIQLLNRTTQMVAENTAASLAGTAILPTRDPVELSSFRIQQSGHAYEARNAELEAELLAMREQEVRAGLTPAAAAHPMGDRGLNDAVQAQPWAADLSVRETPSGR